MNAADLKSSVTASIERLAKLTSDATRSEVMLSFLKTCSRFYKYSLHNQLLIALACPHATRVAGYNDWRKFNRFVRKGEHGIPIFAPCFYKADPKDDESPSELRGFRVVYVFDVSQTDGEDLPEPPDWISPGNSSELEEALMNFAISKGIQIEIKELKGKTQGRSSGGKITLAPGTGTSTLIHELAHELFDHKHSPLSRETEELEAEAVAFAVSEHFGVPTTGSANYLALWQADSEKLLARMDRIRVIVAEIVNSVEGTL